MTKHEEALAALRELVALQDDRDRRLGAINGTHHSAAWANARRIIAEAPQDDALAKDASSSDGKPPFAVTVVPMKESHRTTYWVTLTRSDRPKDASPFDDIGRTTPYVTEYLDCAESMAREWAAFLGVEPPETSFQGPLL